MMDQKKEAGTSMEQSKGDETLLEPSANFDIRNVIEQMSQMMTQNFEIQNKKIDERIASEIKILTKKIDKKIETENKILTEKIDKTVASFEDKITALHTKLLDSNTALHTEIDKTNRKLDEVETVTQNLEREILERVNKIVKVKKINKIRKQTDTKRINNNKQDMTKKIKGWKTKRICVNGINRVYFKMVNKRICKTLENIDNMRNKIIAIQKRVKYKVETWYANVQDRYEIVGQLIELLIVKFWVERLKEILIKNVRQKWDKNLRELFRKSIRWKCDETKEILLLSKFKILILQTFY